MIQRGCPQVIQNVRFLRLETYLLFPDFPPDVNSTADHSSPDVTSHALWLSRNIQNHHDASRHVFPQIVVSGFAYDQEGPMILVLSHLDRRAISHRSFDEDFPSLQGLS